MLLNSILKNINLSQIIEKQIERLLLALAKKENCDNEKIAIMFFLSKGKVKAYPVKDGKYLNELSAKEIETILTS